MAIYDNSVMRSFHFGVEIEVVGVSRGVLAEAIRRVVDPHGRHYMNPHMDEPRIYDERGRAWHVVHDGSLGGSELGRRGAGEVVSPILDYGDIDLLHSVVRAIREVGAQADWTTGIHVHVGADAFGPKSIRNLVKLIRKQEELLEHALGIYDRRIVKYCRRIEERFLERLERVPPTSLEELKCAWYGSRHVVPDRRHDSRYRGLNLNSYFYRRTIEFRYFNGSVDPDRVKAYVHLVLALAAMAMTAKAASSKRRDFRIETAKYDWRVFLNRLGLKGSEFKMTRRLLTKHLAGSAAWKGERRDRRPAETAATPAQVGALTRTEDGSDDQRLAA